MEAAKKRKIKSGEEFNHLFPKPLFDDPTIKKGATVTDTVQFIPKVVSETLFHTSKLAPLLKGENIYESCKNIWEFVYQHIAYKKDAKGKEQIRSPARGWHDRFHGIDCDCYTVFISSVLSNLKIKHQLRITKYKEDHFQHIYPIVPLRNGTYITVDCVVDRFNYEEPYSEKQDTNMDLEYLNGVPNTNSVDVQDLMGWEELEGGDLGKIKLFKKMTQPPGSAGGKKNKLKDLIHKGLHVTNRLNPATALIREGILISMKLNIFKVAQRLKYAYLTDADAKKKEMDMTKFQKLKSVREKLEKIFYDAGGKPENMKKAILTGRGNSKSKHDVNGLGYLPDDMTGMDEDTPSKILLGTDVYDSESFSGIGELGSATAAAASITAATGVVGAIAGLLKGIGNIFPKKNAEGKDFENPESQTGDGTSPDEVKKNMPALKITNSDEVESGDNSDGNSKKASDTSSDGKPESFWEKNKKWIKPTAIGLTGLGLVYLGVKMMKKSPAPKSISGGQLKGLKTKKKGGKGKKKEAIALM